MKIYTKYKQLTHRIVIVTMLLTAILGLSGCALFKEEKVELTAFQKEQSKRIVELGEYMHKLLDAKYPDEGFDEGGPRSVSDEGLEFFFTSRKSGVLFVLEYKGDYLSNKLPDEIKGKIEDVYASHVTNELIHGYVDEISKKVFTGVFGENRSSVYFEWDGDGDGVALQGPEKGSAEWIVYGWDDGYQDYFDLDKLLHEKSDEMTINFTFYYFKDVNKENADLLYKEIFDFVNTFKELGFKRIEITMSIYDEKWLNDKSVDFKDFDGEDFDFNLPEGNDRSVTFVSKWTSLDEFNDVQSMKDYIRVVESKSDNLNEWIGGRKDGK